MDWGLGIAIGASWALYFYWQRNRYLAGKRLWMPAIVFPVFCLVTGIRFPERDSPLKACAQSRNSQRIARFLKRADDLWMSKKRVDGLLPPGPRR